MELTMDGIKSSDRVITQVQSEISLSLSFYYSENGPSATVFGNCFNLEEQYNRRDHEMMGSVGEKP